MAPMHPRACTGGASTLRLAPLLVRVSVCWALLVMVATWFICVCMLPLAASCLLDDAVFVASSLHCRDFERVCPRGQ